MSKIVRFEEEFPSLDSYWRSIILFGKNVATYKFALAKSLLELVEEGRSEVTLEELAVPYSKHLCEHLLHTPKQVTSSKSLFLDTCKQYNEGSVGLDELIGITTKRGFNNVIDAFHVVNDSELPISFYEKAYSRGNKKIILTDNVHMLKETAYFSNFIHEAEARWNLVETAWSMGISKNLLNIQYDDKSEILFIEEFRRKDVTSARDALNGYQKGRCFYCFDDITVDPDSDNLCDVDHFYPHALQPYTKANLNGVWNLVLACPTCNRGERGKFAKVPATKYLERLHKRNEYLISSHHPLRETLMNQTSLTEEGRTQFLKDMDKFAISMLIQRWETEEVKEATF